VQRIEERTESQMSDLVLIGLNHRTAGVEKRERAALPATEVPGALADLTARPGIQEALILSTCNRVEIVSRVDETSSAFGVLESFLAEVSGLPQTELADSLYRYAGNLAVQHVFRVASSLDSMILGEPQILGQVKSAYGLAVEAGSSGTVLNNLFQAAFRVAKRVRSETSIGEYSVSVSSAAVELARKILGNLGSKVILIVGAGKMGEGTVRHLADGGAGSIFVTNRSAEAAGELAERFHGTAVPFDQLRYWLAHSDIIIVSTAAPNVIIDRGMVASAMHIRRNRPIVFIDMSVPRNVDPAVSDIDNAFCYDIDDLGAVVEANLEERRGAAAVAEKLVHQETEAFWARMKSMDVAPMVVEVRRRIEEVCHSELERYLKKNGPRDPKEIKELEIMVSRIAGKMSHPLVTQIKSAHEDPTHERALLTVVSRLFRFHKDPG
jgi:glutamyl-tRNA reductase